MKVSLHGSLGYRVSFKTKEFWDKESGLDFKDNKQVLAWFKQEYKEWNSVWHELIENENTLFIPPIYTLPFQLHSADGYSNMAINPLVSFVYLIYRMIYYYIYS